MHGHHLAKLILAIVFGIILGLGFYQYNKNQQPSAPAVAAEEIT